MKNRLTVAIADIIIGALIALIPFNLLPVCGHEEKKMACFFTAKAEVVLGIAIAFLGIIYLFSKLLQGFINLGNSLHHITKTRIGSEGFGILHDLKGILNTDILPVLIDFFDKIKKIFIGNRCLYPVSYIGHGS